MDSRKTSTEIYAADLDRVKALARQLTEQGPGRYFNPDAIRYLLDFREDTVARITASLEGTDQ